MSQMAAAGRDRVSERADNYSEDEMEMTRLIVLPSSDRVPFPQYSDMPTVDVSHSAEYVEDFTYVQKTISKASLCSIQGSITIGSRC